MIHSEDIYWILLAYESKLGPIKCNQIISRCYNEYQMTLEDLYHLSEEELVSKFDLSSTDAGKIIQSNTLATGQSFTFEALENDNVRLLKSIDTDYPSKLKESMPDNHPPVLFCLGDLGMFDKKIVAMIGQREAHPKNLEFVHKSAQYFASQQIVVISGFAKGVDQEAYLGAVEGGGQTIVVLAEGILSAKSAFRKISSAIEEGQVMVLSQFHPNSHWQTGLAMARNSVVVAMADVTLVGQTKIDGGSMDGAKKGIKLNKPIFVVTNPDTDLAGANLLIKQGARPIELSDNPIEETLAPVIKVCYEERKIIVSIVRNLPKPDDNQLKLIDLPEIPVKPKKPRKKK